MTDKERIEKLEDERDAALAKLVEMRKSLEEVIGDYSGGAQSAIEDPYVLDRCNSVLAATATAVAEYVARLKEEAIKDHMSHVSRWLAEMYAAMVDPVDDNTLTIEETCKLLLDTALEQRQQIHDFTQQEARLREQGAAEYRRSMLGSAVSDALIRETLLEVISHECNGYVPVESIRAMEAAIEDLPDEEPSINEQLIEALTQVEELTSGGKGQSAVNMIAQTALRSPQSFSDSVRERSRAAALEASNG